MLEYIKELSTEDQERMQEVLGRLFRQTYLLERTYDRKAGRLVSSADYYFAEKHFEFLQSYLSAAGIRLESSTELGTIYVQGTALMGERLPKLATIYLLLLKLIFDEQMASASSNVNIITTFGALNAKVGEFRLAKSQPSLTEVRRALAILKKYQMIEPLDSLEELEENTRLLIYPCINLVLMREDIRGLLASFEEEAPREGSPYPDAYKEGLSEEPDRQEEALKYTGDTEYDENEEE